MDKEAADLDSIFEKWRATQNPEHFKALYTAMKPDIEKAGMKASYGSNIPQAAHKIYQAQVFMDALRTFNPERGKLKTHVYGAVQNKAKRLNYLYQDIGYKPEPRASKVGLYQNEYENLRQYLGREPSTTELADQLGWNQKDVVNIQKEVVKDLAISDGIEEHAVAQGSRDLEVLNFLYYELSGEEKLVYDYVLGAHGKPKLVKPGGKTPDYDKIARQAGFSASKARTVWKRVGAKLKKALEK